MPLPLIALFIAAFAFGTTEFVIAGVLPQVAGGLGVSVPTAGYLVSGYALGIAIGGPLLTLATPKVARKTLLLWLTLVFTLGQVACALAPDFFSMLALRVAVAVAHGTYFGVAMVVATSLVSEERRGMAVDSLVSGGTIISGATVHRSLLFSRVRVHSYAQIEDSVILPDVDIGRHAKLRRVVLDKHCHIPENMTIGYDAETDRRRFHVSEHGITLVTPEMLGQQAHHIIR